MGISVAMPARTAAVDDSTGASVKAARVPREGRGSRNVPSAPSASQTRPGDARVLAVASSSSSPCAPPVVGPWNTRVAEVDVEARRVAGWRHAAADRKWRARRSVARSIAARLRTCARSERKGPSLP